MPKFKMGAIVATPNALSVVSGLEMLIALTLHQSGKWGELDPEDCAANERALLHGGRLFSSYRTYTRKKFYVITEADRSATTVLLPQDY